MVDVGFGLASLTKGSVPTPIIELTFTNPNNSKSFKTIGIIDSGADVCTLPFSIEKILELNLKKSGAERSLLTCACGKAGFSGYKFKLDVSGTCTDKSEFKKLISVIFAEAETVSLIGRNFLDLFERIE